MFIVVVVAVVVAVAVIVVVVVVVILLSTSIYPEKTFAQGFTRPALTPGQFLKVTASQEKLLSEETTTTKPGTFINPLDRNHDDQDEGKQIKTKTKTKTQIEG